VRGIDESEFNWKIVRGMRKRVSSVFS
jgi:hypothetical protein